ncbi:hypothetical protein [Paenibacillus aestuarii]|uniref:Uncharacterized protein n=1 Tax=Paenibacillus aestuarii TaxID=516965 RepID=A0ABW0K5G2_9BACL
MNQMVESIVRELIAGLKPEAIKPPKVLYVFCDSTAHEAFSDHFILLRKNGIAFDFMFLDGETSAWLGKHRIESAGPGRTILSDEYAPTPLEVPKAYEGIIIPEIDLDNAGRISLGMKGTVKAELVFAALVLNKFVLVADDAPGMKRADRRILQSLTLPKSYQKLFEYYRKEMAMYGVEFAPAKELAEVVVQKCVPNSRTEEVESAPVPVITADSPMPVQPVEVKMPVLRFEGRLLSAEWVKRQQNLSQFSYIALSRGTLVSPLAKDLLRDHGIALHDVDDEQER